MSAMGANRDLPVTPKLDPNILFWILDRYVYIYIYICNMYICAFCVCIYTYICICMCSHVSIYTTYICMYMSAMGANRDLLVTRKLDPNILFWIWIGMCIFMYTYMCVCVCVCA